MYLMYLFMIRCEMKTLWKIIAWISIVCGLASYFMAWAAIFTGSVLWGVPTEFWFYDAIAAWIFAIFFLVYAVYTERK